MIKENKMKKYVFFQLVMIALMFSIFFLTHGIQEKVATSIIAIILILVIQSFINIASSTEVENVIIKILSTLEILIAATLIIKLLQ